jgi:starvation-inducible DNA-binding protein
VSGSETLKHKPKITQVDLGIKKEEIGHVVQGLSAVLASTYLLYMKTQGFHWNVVGPLFFPLHKLTEELYGNLAEAIDTLAERIRALGHIAPTNYAWYQKLSHIEEASENLEAGEMVKQLMVDHELMARLLKDGFDTAEKAKDHATADLFIQRLHFHEKAAWMLRATLGH